MDLGILFVYLLSSTLMLYTLVCLTIEILVKIKFVKFVSFSQKCQPKVNHFDILGRLREKTFQPSDSKPDALTQGFPTLINRGPHTCQSGHKAGHTEQNQGSFIDFLKNFDY